MEYNYKRINAYSIQDIENAIKNKQFLVYVPNTSIEAINFLEEHKDDDDYAYLYARYLIDNCSKIEEKSIEAFKIYEKLFRI